MDQITEGIVFRQIKMATGRRMILLFTKKYGKISVGTNISEKGRTRSSLALRPFTYGSYHIFEGRNYFNLDKADSIRSFYSIGEDLDKYVSAGFVLELTEKAVPEGIPQPAVFQVLLDFMEEISERNGQHRTLVLAYEIQLLRILGFFPKLDSCACCGRPGNWKSFSVPDGGTICPECREKKSASGEDSLIYDTEFDIVNVIQYFAGNPMKAFRKLALQKDAAEHLQQIIRRYLEMYLDIGKLKSESMWNESV